MEVEIGDENYDLSDEIGDGGDVYELGEYCGVVFGDVEVG